MCTVPDKKFFLFSPLRNSKWAKILSKINGLTGSFPLQEQKVSPTYPYSFLTQEFTLFCGWLNCVCVAWVFSEMWEISVFGRSHCHKGEGNICSRNHFSFSLRVSHTDSNTKCSQHLLHYISTSIPTLHVNWCWQHATWDHWKRLSH